MKKALHRRNFYGGFILNEKVHQSKYLRHAQ